MSYFVFGVVAGVRAGSLQSIGNGIEVRWGAVLQQAVVTRMLEEHGCLAAKATPFCVSLIGEDTSDDLVCPYPADRELVISRFGFLLEWLEGERGGSDAELWITEGYDDAFEEFVGSCEELQRIIREAVLITGDVRSLRLRLDTSPVRRNGGT